MIWIAFVCALGILTEAALIALVMRSEHPPAPKKSDVLIVLGARTRASKPTETLRLRLECAAEAYRTGLAPKIIVSGGRKHGVKAAEAEIMAQYLIQKGIPAQYILIEKRSLHTSENLRESARLMEASGATRGILVTSGYHLFRAQWQARAQGLSLSAIAAPGAPRWIWYGRFRETVAIVKFIVFRT